MKVEEDKETQEREQNMMKNLEQIENEIEEEHKRWEQDMTRRRDMDRRELAKTLSSTEKDGKATKRKEEGSTKTGSRNKRAKRRKYELLQEDWGATLSQSSIPNRDGEQDNLVTGSPSEPGQDPGEHQPATTPTTGSGEQEDNSSLTQARAIMQRVWTQQEITGFLEAEPQLARPRAELLRKHNPDTVQGEEDLLGRRVCQGGDDGDDQTPSADDHAQRIRLLEDQDDAGNDDHRILQGGVVPSLSRIQEEPFPLHTSDVVEGHSTSNSIVLEDKLRPGDDNDDDEGISGHTRGDDDKNGGSDDRVMRCEFKRGICTEHRVRDKRHVSSRRGWAKKK